MGRIHLISLCLAGSPHWHGNSERILGVAEHDMDSEESSKELVTGKQGALLPRTPLSPVYTQWHLELSSTMWEQFKTTLTGKSVFSTQSHWVYQASSRVGPMLKLANTGWIQWCFCRLLVSYYFVWTGFFLSYWSLIWFLFSFLQFSFSCVFFFTFEWERKHKVMCVERWKGSWRNWKGETWSKHMIFLSIKKKDSIHSLLPHLTAITGCWNMGNL